MTEQEKEAIILKITKATDLLNEVFKETKGTVVRSIVAQASMQAQEALSVLGVDYHADKGESQCFGTGR